MQQKGKEWAEFGTALAEVEEHRTPEQHLNGKAATVPTPELFCQSFALEMQVQ